VQRFPVGHTPDIEGLTDKEAVEYLLDFIQSANQRRYQSTADLMDLITGQGGRVGTSPAMLFTILYERKNGTVLFDSIFDAMEMMTGRIERDRTVVATWAKRLRRSIGPPLNWPVEIKSAYGLGYRMNVPDGWSPEAHQKQKQDHLS
jgi:DNA-binding response OmpR family regulator